jgi:hypothetical protein
MVRVAVACLMLARVASAGPCAWDDKKFEPAGDERVAGKTKPWLERNFSAGKLVCKLADHWVYHSEGCSDWDRLLRIWFRDGKVVRVEGAKIWTGKICEGDLGRRSDR